MVIFYKLSDIDSWSIIYVRDAVKSKLCGYCLGDGRTIENSNPLMCSFHCFISFNPVIADLNCSRKLLSGVGLKIGRISKALDL